jgi:monoamine oxidase
MLQQGCIRFTPPLPRDKAKAVAKADVWEGIKVFVEFSERFYPTSIDVHVEPKNAGHVLYFDAAYGQKTTRNILGLFAVGAPARPYLALNDAEIKAYILDELEAMFPGKARQRYVRHLVQNWSAEPYIAGAYLNDHENWKTLPILAEPIEERVYFAGDAYTSGEDWGNVHEAVVSARRAVRKILR